MYVNYMQIDTSYKPGSPSWESWAPTQLSEANQHQHHSDTLFQSHPTNPAVPEVVLTRSSVAWVLSTLFVTWDSCWKSQTQVVMRSGCQTHLWGVVSLTKLWAGRGIGKRVIWHGAKPAYCSLHTSRIILLGILSLLKSASDSKPLTAKALRRGEGTSSFSRRMAFLISGWLRSSYSTPQQTLS